MKLELLKIYARNHLTSVLYLMALLVTIVALRVYFYGVTEENENYIALFFCATTVIICFLKQQAVYKQILKQKIWRTRPVIQVAFTKLGFLIPLLLMAFWPLHTAYLYDHLLGYAFVACALALNVSLGAVFLPLFLWDVAIYLIFSGLIVYINYDVQETPYVGTSLFVCAFFSIVIGFRINRSAFELVKKTGQLNRAAKAAAKANKAKSDFLAVMSHEIRTPMNGILGMVDILQETKLNAEQDNAVKTILGCSDSLLNTLNDILDISKIEAGKFAIHNTPYDLHKLIDRAGRLVEKGLSNKGVGLKTTISDDVPQFVIGDEQRIQQIVLNLLNNAAKFTSHGHVGLYVSHKDNDGVPTLLFEIHDTGIGISAENQKKLFKQFSQTDSSISASYGGTGLGLFISHKLVTLMEGRIGVDSQVDQGSVFWFELPCNLADRDQVEQDKASMIKQHDDLAVQKILLADDNELNRMIVQKMLQNRGHTVNLAQNGEEAIFMAQQQHYDIILMDINMPFVDGIEATKGIKKLSKSRAAIPVIALTASTKQEIIQECLKVGMVDYLLKPIEKEKLFDAIYHFGKKSDDLGAREAVQKTDLAYTKARNEKFETLVEEFGEEYAIDLCRQFIDAIEEKLLEIDTYISANDYDAIYRVAHDLSGMVGNIGLEESLERARKLEMASSKKTGDFPVLKKELSDCFCLEKQWLNSYVEQKS